MYNEKLQMNVIRMYYFQIDASELNLTDWPIYNANNF